MAEVKRVPQNFIWYISIHKNDEVAYLPPRCSTRTKWPGVEERSHSSIYVRKPHLPNRDILASVVSTYGMLWCSTHLTAYEIARSIGFDWDAGLGSPSRLRRQVRYLCPLKPLAPITIGRS